MIPIQKALLSRLPEYIDLSDITTVAIPLCFGDPRNFDDGCHDRFNTSIRNLVPRKSLVIQTGGTKSLPLCDLMLECIKLKRKNWATQFLSIPLGWGTRPEIANAFSIIELLNSKELSNGISIFDPTFKVVIASNKAHLKRIEWFVKIYNEHGIRVEYQEAQHEFGPIDTLRESIGTPLIKVKDLFLGLEHLRYTQEDEFSNQFYKPIQDPIP